MKVAISWVKHVNFNPILIIIIIQLPVDTLVQELDPGRLSLQTSPFSHLPQSCPQSSAALQPGMQNVPMHLPHISPSFFNLDTMTQNIFMFIFVFSPTYKDDVDQKFHNIIFCYLIGFANFFHFLFLHQL